MKHAADLEQAAIRKVAAPRPAADWVRCADGAPYFQTESGAAWTPVAHNEAITWPNIEPLYARRDPQAVDRHFAMLKASGVTCLRLMLDYSQVRHRNLESRCGRFSPQMVRLWDDLIALGERHDIRFLLTPFDTFFMARRWKTHPYSHAMGGPSKSPRHMFTCPATRAAIIARMHFATRRWGHSQAVFGWDLWNEIDSFYAGGDMAAAHGFVSELSDALRAEEMALHGRAHLQTVSVYYPVLVERPAVGDIVFRHPGLDFASVHLYEKGTIDQPRSSLAPAEATMRLMSAALAQCPAERPLLDTEHGPIHAFKDRHVTLPDDFDTDCFRRTQWAHLASGGAGGGMRWPYRHPHVLIPAMHDAQAVLARFLPLIDWQNFRRQRLGDRLSARSFDGLVMGCGDDAQAIVCLMGSRAQCGHGCAVDIAGFRPGIYAVTQMNMVTGEQEKSLLQTTADSTLTVLVGSGAPDVALAVVRSGDRS